NYIFLKTLSKFLNRNVHFLLTIYKGQIHTKRSIIGSIFPEKLEFDGKTYRTTRMNVIANYIFQINNGSLQNKNRTNENIFHLSCLVAKTGVEPVTSGLGILRSNQLSYLAIGFLFRLQM